MLVHRALSQISILRPTSPLLVCMLDTEVDEFSDGEVDPSYIEEWKGKTWPERLPVKLIIYINSRLTKWGYLLPPPSLSLEDLTTTTPPTVYSRLITTSASQVRSSVL